MAPGESLISPYMVVIVTPGYIETLDIPLKSGRTFNDSDTETSAPVVIVDDRLARKFWPGADPHWPPHVPAGEPERSRHAWQEHPMAHRRRRRR